MHICDSKPAVLIPYAGKAPPTCILKDTACSCDLRACSLVTACLLRIRDLAITFTASYSAAADRTERVGTWWGWGGVGCSWCKGVKVVDVPHHLPLLCHLLNLGNRFLLLLLQPHTFPIQLTYGLVKHALVLPQHLCKQDAIRSQSGSKQLIRSKLTCELQQVALQCCQQQRVAVQSLPLPLL